MLKISIFSLMIIWASLLNAQNNRQIAITLDDLPTLSHGVLSDQEQTEYFQRILSILDTYEAKATGFVSGKLIRNENKELLDLFVSKGHYVGNHTQSHYDLNKTFALEYCKDIQLCQDLIKVYVTDEKYFRYPMLHRGMDAERKDSVLNFLTENAYIIAPVSIDSDEADYNYRFVKAFQKKDTALMTFIGKEYIEHMISQSMYYDSMAIEVNQKPIRHILLLHMNFINSFYLDDLLDWYAKHQWEFVDLRTALDDPFYSRKENYLGRKGLSYIERVLY